MKKNSLLLAALAIVIVLPLSSFKSEKQTLKKSSLNFNSKKAFTEVEFGDFVLGGGLAYGVYGDSGTTNITSIRNVYNGNPPISYTVTYYDGAYIVVSGTDELGNPFSYSGHLVWA
jgi:uncharacterized secreted protein with C-terminal beta-propeller domain